MIRGWAFYLGYLVTVASLALAGCERTPEGNPTPRVDPLPTRSAGTIYTVARGTIEKTVTVAGRVVSTREETVAFSESGRLTRLHVTVNQAVKQGDLLAELDTRTLENQLRVAKAQAEIAQLKVDQAMGKDLSDAESGAVTAARATMSQTEAAYAAAQIELDRRQAGPSQAERETAAAAVLTAAAQLEKDQAALTRLQAPPSAAEMTILQASLGRAETALKRAQVAYDRVKDRPDISELSESTALQLATLDYNRARAEFDLATAGPSSDAVASMTRQISADQASLRAAQTRLDEVRQGASSQELDTARQNVNAARATLDAARAALERATAIAAGKGLGAQIAQKEAGLAQLQVQILQAQIDDRQVRAPFDGIVTSIAAHEGDSVEPSAPILTVADPTRLEVTTAAPVSDLPMIAAGQVATVSLLSAPSAPLAGRVGGIIGGSTVVGSANSNSSLAASESRTVAPPMIRIGLNTASSTLALGAPVEATIVIDRQEDTLVLPSTAIQEFGGNRFVRVIGAHGRSHDLDVQVGISDGIRTEITAGLQEGQEVIAPER